MFERMAVSCSLALQTCLCVPCTAMWGSECAVITRSLCLVNMKAVSKEQLRQGQQRPTCMSHAAVLPEAGSSLQTEPFMCCNHCFLIRCWLPAGCFGLDIGPKTAQLFAEAVAGCKTLFWNGPMGRFEVPGFAAGTEAIARAMSKATDAGATTVVGGGLPQRLQIHSVKCWHLV
jgi:hypothetical protein